MQRTSLYSARAVSLFLVAILILIAAYDGVSSLSRANAAVLSSVPISFTWAMKERFGEVPGEKMVNYHWDSEKEEYDDSYVHPTSWTVDFNACGGAPAESQLRWEIDGQALAETRCHFSHGFPALRTYVVKLTATTAAGESTAEASVVLKDWLIVSIGDSFASGEGNPDKPGIHGAQWIDKRCHRSAWAAPSRAAVLIEKADAHSSVTFISFACSGAGIQEGLLDVQMKGSHPVRPQLARLFETAGDRRIDALLVSIGGNDAHFAELVDKAIRLRHAETDEATKRMLDSGLESLPDRFSAMAQKLADPTNKAVVANVFIAEYPDIVRDETRDFCDHSVSFADVLHGISEAESSWALNNVIIPLNSVIRQQANNFKWIYVDGILSQFGGDSPDQIAHGFCADDKRWANTFLDSMRHQGDFKGTVHPNHEGHLWYVQRLVAEMHGKGIPVP